jgi:hypothetical protein
MNSEIATYIRGLTEEVSKDIWLDAVIGMKRNGNSIIIKRDVLLKYRITEETFNSLFNVKHAENLDLIKIIAQGETFIAINFLKKKIPVKISKMQQKEEDKANMKKNTNANLVVVYNKPTIILNEFGLNTETINEHFEMTDKCRKIIIAVYCEFFKRRSADKTYLAGATHPINPRMGAREIAALTRVARYFAKEGFNTETKVIIAFQRMFEKWHLISEWLQKFISPSGIDLKINDIVLELQAGKQNNKPKPTIKDEQFNSKVDAARQKDYSHLAKS